MFLKILTGLCHYSFFDMPDTRHLIWEEKHILDFLRAHHGHRVNFWTLINMIARDLGKSDYRVKRKTVVPLVTRLIQEKKIIRKHNTKMNVVRIHEALM
jgi:hypothetical protein